MLKYDSVHGRFAGDISVEGNTLIVNGRKIRLTAVKDPGRAEVGRGRGRGRRRVDRAVPDQGNRREAPRGRRQEGHHVGTVEGRHADVRLRRESRQVRRRGDHLQRLLHDQLPGARGQGPARHLGHQARPDDDRARGHRDAEDGRRPVEQGLARRARHPREHHSVVHRGGQGRRQGHPGAEQEAHRHVVPRAHVRRVGRRPDGRAQPRGDLRADLRGDEGRVRGTR